MAKKNRNQQTTEIIEAPKVDARTQAALDQLNEKETAINSEIEVVTAKLAELKAKRKTIHSLRSQLDTVLGTAVASAE